VTPIIIHAWSELEAVRAELIAAEFLKGLPDRDCPSCGSIRADSYYTLCDKCGADWNEAHGLDDRAAKAAG